MNRPSWRKPFGILAIMGWITVWAVVIVSIAGSARSWPVILQVLFFGVTGIVWIWPLKPLLAWMEAKNHEETPS